MKKDREEWWVATYSSARGNLVTINNVKSSECPVSLTDGWIFQVLFDFSEATRFEGCAMYGTNLAEWPADVFDAFSIFQYEENRIESAKMEVARALITLR